MKTSKYYLIGLTAIVVSLMCCGPVSAETWVYDFDDLTVGSNLNTQDGWYQSSGGTNITVRDGDSANMHGVPDNYKLSGNVAECLEDSDYHRINDANWGFSIPSSATEVQFSYTIFTRGERSNLAGLYMDDQSLFRFGVNYNSNEWRFRGEGGQTTAAGTGDATLTSAYQSYRLTAVLDFTDPTKVEADMLVENLTAESAAVEVISDFDLGLSGEALDPSNWNKLRIRPRYAAMDDLTVTVVPEPSTFVGLLGLGLLGLMAWRRR